jgi:ribosomal protein S18 acetylase RimI-like enzyme
VTDDAAIDLTVRAATERDIEGCLAVDRAVGPRRFDDGLFRERVRDGALFVAAVDGEVVGYITFGKRYWTWLWFVDMVRVHPAFRRRGAARALYAAVEAACTSPYLLSSAMDSNTVSQRMHAALGFREQGFVRNPSGGREVIFLKEPGC